LPCAIAYRFCCNVSRFAELCTQCHAGAPLHLDVAEEFTDKPTPQQLQAVLTSERFCGVRLYYSVQDEQWPPPPQLPPLVVSALAGSASMLTALHDLPLIEPRSGSPELVLAAFTQLRELSLRQTWHLDVLRAAELPASLEDLQLIMDIPDNTDALINEDPPPFFEAFDRLHSLRRITLTDFRSWQLHSWDDTESHWHPAPPPPSLEVCGASTPVAADA